MNDNFTSQKFRFWSFVSMVLLVFVHGYNLNQRYLQPWTLPGEVLTLNTFTQYFLANGIFRFRIPMLFIISGYLYATKDFEPYKKRIRKRVLTLLLPYLIWSALGILFTYSIELSDFGRNLVASSHIVQIDNKRMLIHDYKWYELLLRWVFLPVPYQLWFVRVLFIYNISYPALRWCVLNKTARYIWFSMVALLWLSNAGFILFEGEGLLFFSLGIWLQKTNFNINSPGKMLPPILWGIIFIMLSVTKTIIAFNGESLFGSYISPILLILHKLVIISGLIFSWYGLDRLVNLCMQLKWFEWMSSFSFIIYAIHTPLVAYAINGVFKYVCVLPDFRLLTFIFLPLSVIALSIGIGVILRKWSNSFYGILTGGRGMN